MSEEQLKDFIEKIKANPALKNLVNQASSNEELANIAEAEGCQLNSDELQALSLSDGELESVVGGNGTRKPGFCRTNVASWEDKDAGKVCGGGC